MVQYFNPHIMNNPGIKNHNRELIFQKFIKIIPLGICYHWHFKLNCSFNKTHMCFLRKKKIQPNLGKAFVS